MQKPKVSIIGTGRWGKNLLRELVAQTEVVWCGYKGNTETKQFLIDNYPTIKPTNNYEEILADESVEAVFVATPTDTHFEIAKKVLVAKKHLFLEKPGCSHSEELEILCDLAKKENLNFAVGYEFVYHPVLKKIIELTTNQDLKMIHTEWFKWGTFNDPAHKHLLSHEISIIKKLTRNQIEPIYFKQHKIISDSDITYTEFTDDKTNISCIINRASKEKRKTVTIVTSNDTLVWNNDELFRVDQKEKMLAPIMTEKVSPVAEEIKDFLRCLTEKKEPETNGLFALETYKVVEKCLKI